MTGRSEGALIPLDPASRDLISKQGALLVGRGLALAGTLLYVRGDGALEADRDSQWAELFEAAEQARTGGRFQEAERLYSASVLVARTFGPLDLRLGRSLAGLAAALQGTDRSGEALEKYGAALPILQAALGEDPIVGWVLNKMGHLLTATGSYAQAEARYEEALTVWRDTLGAAHENVAAVNYTLGYLYSRQRLYEKSESSYREAMEIWAKALGKDHQYVGVVMRQLGSLAESQDQNRKAESLYRQALLTLRRALGMDHVEVAQTLRDLASLYQREERPEAADLYQEALNILEGQFNPIDDKIWDLRMVTATAYRMQGRYKEAEEIYKKELADRERCLGPEGVGVAGALSCLAGISKAQGRYEEAESLYRRALMLREKRLGPEHSEVATYHESIAELCLEQRRFEEAEASYQRALAIRQKTADSDGLDVADCRIRPVDRVSS